MQDEPYRDVTSPSPTQNWSRFTVSEAFAAAADEVQNCARAGSDPALTPCSLVPCDARLESAWRLQQNLLKKQKDERDRTRDSIIDLREDVAGQDGTRAAVLERLDAILKELQHHG